MGDEFKKAIEEAMKELERAEQNTSKESRPRKSRAKAKMSKFSAKAKRELK